VPSPYIITDPSPKNQKLPITAGAMICDLLAVVFSPQLMLWSLIPTLQTLLSNGQPYVFRFFGVISYIVTHFAEKDVFPLCQL
jgi:hypothetical protein